MSYLRDYLTGENLRLTLENILALDFPRDFDTIAVRGNSGLLLGAILAERLQKNLIIVRKNEASHSGSKVEGWGINQRILIVDDFISTGDTVDIIYETIVETCDSPTIVGILLYASRLGYGLSYYQHPDSTEFPVWSVPRRALEKQVEEQAK